MPFPLSVSLVSIPGSLLCLVLAYCNILWLVVLAYCNILWLVPLLSSNPTCVSPTSSSLSAVTYAYFMRAAASLNVGPYFRSRFFLAKLSARAYDICISSGCVCSFFRTQGDRASSAYLDYINRSVERRTFVGSNMRNCLGIERPSILSPEVPCA